MVEQSAGLTTRELGYSEALAIWMTRYVDISGYQCQLTLEAESGAELMKKAQGAIAYLTECKCTPLPLGNHNGNGQGKDPNPVPAKETQKESQSRNQLCPIHGTPMKRWTKGERSWFSHKVDGRWCRGEEA